MSIKCGHCKGRHDTVIAVKECSMGQDCITPAPNAVAFVPTKPVIEVGIYRKGTSVYRVRKGKKGYLYAEALLIRFPGAKGQFVYAAGAVKALTADMKMTLVEAQEFGHACGVCCVCGALLTDPKSVDAGIGPVCAKKF